MERLTHYDNCGVACFMWKKPSGDIAVIANEAISRLAAYEDTGLTPEEVKDAIFLPCKIGDKAWAIRSYGRHQKAVEGVVSEMYFLGHRGEDMRLVVVVKNVARGLYGKAVFATRAEAEEALKGDIK